jgi:hypothetical protein|tara:strand:- start:1136 stop:1408 length:273 start_codon:yes stop_codon:yes gene_type:complete
MIKKSSFIVLYIILPIGSPKYSYTASLDENRPVETVTPPPPVNDICTGAINLGVIGCEFLVTYEADPEATPDPEVPTKTYRAFYFSFPFI